MKKPMIKPSHKGRLHEALGIAEGQPIPSHQIEYALKSQDPHIRAMAQFAKNAKHFKHS